MTDRHRIIETENLCETLEEILGNINHSGLFILTDSNVAVNVLPIIADAFVKKFSARVITIEAGEEHKQLETLAEVWRELSDSGATRNSLLINLGGGVVTDLGGFAAATFKRGMRFINVPTTVLGAVDASIGGKTGIDFNGLKNEIGTFAQPEAVIISSEPLTTLSAEETVSGFGEIVKTAMISSEDFYRNMLNEDILSDTRLLRTAMTECVRFKAKITEEDPRESGLRKILNFGHTAGHALETLMLHRHTPVSHGCAVANGILIALILSHTILGLPSKHIYLYKDHILNRHFKRIGYGCKDYEGIAEIISHDKKNTSSSKWNFVLLREIGKPEYDINVTKEDLFTALDIYNDLT